MRILLISVVVGSAFLITGLVLCLAVTQPVWPVKSKTRSVFVDAARLERHVRTLSEAFFPRDFRHPSNLDRAAGYIHDEFERSGGFVSEQVYKVGESTYRNVIARFGPDSAERVVVGAHYDAFGEFPGADDNASGVAGLIELAHLVGKTPLSMKVELIAFTLEEPFTADGPGTFRSPNGGSAVHARSLVDQGASVRLMICLEMIGYFNDGAATQRFPSSALKVFYPSRGNWAAVIGKMDQGSAVRRVKRAMREGSNLPIYSISAPESVKGMDWSDHYNYWKAGYSAVMITDTAIYRNANYHTANDTALTLDYGKMAQVVQGVHRAVIAATENSPMAGAYSNYFSSDYFAARSRFRDKVSRAGGLLEALTLDAKGPSGEDLSIDIGWFGPEKPSRVLLHSSGLHGVEGFAGSAIQLQLLDAPPALPPDTALVLVHALNPYGMAWLRRVNESNVDLNRNSLFGEPYSGAPKDYPKLDHFLNPPRIPSLDLYRVRAAWLILKYGMASLQQTVAGGQYEYPKGLFFGGKRLEQGLEKYGAFLKERLSSSQTIMGIDIHTGLGKFGEDVLLVSDHDNAELRRIFGERVAPPLERQSVAYEIRGGLDSTISHALPSASLRFVTQEFGTYGPAAVVQALRDENSRYHYEDSGLAASKRTLKETFYPQDDSWRRSVLKRGAELIQQALEQ